MIRPMCWRLVFQFAMCWDLRSKESMVVLRGLLAVALLLRFSSLLQALSSPGYNLGLCPMPHPWSLFRQSVLPILWCTVFRLFLLLFCSSLPSVMFYSIWCQKFLQFCLVPIWVFLPTICRPFHHILVLWGLCPCILGFSSGSSFGIA